jgi:glycosyltransferase involved in cell wall biosynthesis
VAVIIPTMRRVVQLERALRSVFNQVDVVVAWEIIVVDNAPEGPARCLVDRVESVSPVPLIYVHEPHPGVSTARNAGLGATTADLIAFLDDDQEADPKWLADLLEVRSQLGADVVFGPISGRAPEAEAWLRPYVEDFFSRAGAATSELIAKPFGCGNSLFARTSALPGATPFPLAADDVGGEDDQVFATLKERGGTFAWAPGAHVVEHPPAHRANLRFILLRAFRYGQAPSQTAARDRNWSGVIRWMLIGLVQALVFGLRATMLSMVQSPARVHALNKTAQGLGKFLWTKRLGPAFYGAAELRRSAVQAHLAESGSLPL